MYNVTSKKSDQTKVNYVYVLLDIHVQSRGQPGCTWKNDFPLPLITPTYCLSGIWFEASSL